ncbi:MAG: hypothetical protein AB4042_00740 [Leptolyngbyaceae cyanobacterium]
MAIPTKRIGMWTCPRCLSTVLLRSWSNRPDTFVQDEPFYPHFLTVSDRQDPGREAVLKHYETDWKKIVEQLIHGEIPDQKSIYYQKFIVCRLFPHIDLDWVAELTNCFLIREPQEMILSYLKLWPNPTLENLGTLRLRQLFYTVRDTLGTIPPVIDARDLQSNPRQTLSLLCAAVGVEFTEDMLHWPPGDPTDDIWSQYQWYDTVRQSTTFQTYTPKTEKVPDQFSDLLAQCNEVYRELYQYRLG